MMTRVCIIFWAVLSVRIMSIRKMVIHGYRI